MLSTFDKFVIKIFYTNLTLHQKCTVYIFIQVFKLMSCAPFSNLLKFYYYFVAT